MVIYTFIILHIRLYGFIHGNTTKKELDFHQIFTENFDQGKKVESLIDLVSGGKLSLLNAKELAYIIIDGDKRDPIVIATDKGLLGTESINYDKIIEEVLASNKSTVDKIKESGKDGPVMFLVGQVMKKISKQGDPKEIQKLIKKKLGVN